MFNNYSRIENYHNVRSYEDNRIHEGGQSYEHNPPYRSSSYRNPSYNKSFAEEYADLYEILSSHFCGFDTCSLLLYNHREDAVSKNRQAKFLTAVERICREKNILIFTSITIWNELINFTHTGYPGQRYAANYALEFLSRMDDAGLLQTSEKIARVTQSVNADHELHLICLLHYTTIDRPMAIFTQDVDLACAIENLNREKHLAHRKLEVRRVTRNGTIDKFKGSEPMRSYWRAD